MDVIIVGCGKTGFTIARNLRQDGHNIVLIDKKPFQDKVLENIDVMVLQGNGLSGKLLIEAGVKTADLVISVTPSDEANILCCLTAKHLGALHTVARVRDPEYALELYDMRKELGLDMIINPEHQAALEISRLIRFPVADDIETFANGHIELVSFRVTAGDSFSGHSVSQIFRNKNRTPIVLAMLQRGETVIVPRGDTILQNDDTVSILGRPGLITDFFKQTKKSTIKVKNTMIIGGGIIAYYLAALLSRHDIDTKIIELDPERCTVLSNALPHTMIINGDGTDQDLLHEENIRQTDAVVCLSDRDEENIVVGLLCKQLELPKIVVKVNHIDLNIAKNLGLGSICCPKNITALQIVKYVQGLRNAEGRSIRSVYRIFEHGESSVDVVEFYAHTKFKCLDIELQDLQIKSGVLIGSIIRGGKIITPVGSTELRLHDVIIVIAKDVILSDLDDILEESGQ